MQDKTNRCPLTPAAALRAAERNYSGVYRSVPGITGWGYNRWDADRRAWWLPRTTSTYTTKLAERAALIAEDAYLLLYPETERAEIMGGALDMRGTARERLAQLIARHVAA